MNMVRKKTLIMALLMSLVLALVSAAFPVTSTAASVSDLTASGYINSLTGAHLRTGASTKTKSLGVLKNNTPVTIIQEVFTTKKKTGATKRWYLVNANGTKGYVRCDLIDNISYGTATGKAKAKIAYRKGAGSSMKKKGSIKKKKTFTIVLPAKAKGSGKLWYKIRKGGKYYYVSSSKVSLTEVKTAAAPASEPETEQSEYALAVVSGACKWAEKIANDNSFHYGNGKHSRHNGCYFCGTQPKSKQQYVVQWEKTYCCNPFVTAAYAHGGNEPTMMSLCSHGKSWMAPEFRASALFSNLGHPAQSELRKGDILCTSIHVAMYLGNGKLVEAATADDGVPGSSKWNSSIRVTNLTASRYAGFNNGVFRYIGDKDNQEEPRSNDPS